MTQHPNHEWRPGNPHCRQCGLIALSPEERLLADLLLPCIYPNSYGIHTLPDTVENALASRLEAHNEHDRLKWEQEYQRKTQLQQVYEETIQQLNQLLEGDQS